MRPLAIGLEIMSPNCLASTSRPSVVMVYWNSWPVGTGGWPICPAATWMFCCWIGADHVAGGQAAHRHLVRIEPDAHAVVALAQIGDVADARQPGQLVAKLDRGVVAQVEVVAAAVGRKQVDDHQDAGRFLLDRDAAALHQVGQNRLGHRHAVLHQHLGHVQVGAELEGDRQACRCRRWCIARTCTSCPRRR